ncbi:MAG: hypothetical protein IJ511_02035 [Bacteroides sp.]|nr:hypothetical protein [Bacteroides sp.]
MGDTTYEYTDYYYYTYRDLTRLYDAANFVGHFTVNENNEWVKEEGDFNDLQFTCTDENGETCVANLTASDTYKIVYIGETTDEDWGDWRLDSERDEEIFEYEDIYDEDGNIVGSKVVDSYLKHYTEYSIDIAEDTYKHYVFIPEKVTVTITQGGKELVKSVVNTNLSILDDEFDLTKHDFDVTVETYVNDFEILVSKATYAANKSVQAACKLNKNGQNLVTFSAYTGIAFSGSLYDESVELENMDNATFETDILHELQIKGSTSDGKLLSDHVADAMDNDTNLDVVNEKLAEANKLLDIGLYFDGQSTKQCEVKLEAFDDTEWYDDVPHYSWEPVLSFLQEGTTYSFASFFNEDDFHELINLSWDVYDDFGNLVHQFDRDY